jgi:hypothetical protein
LAITVPLRLHEYRWLKWNVEPAPKPDGKRRPLGGYPRLENWCIEHFDTKASSITFDPTHFARLWEYVSPKYGGGGPNRRLRACFIPALRRIGRDPLPEWRVTP